VEQPHVARKLAAILIGDVVGYSRLTAADEEGTLARLSALRHELLFPSIARHRGRIVKTTGDGILVEFASVVDAVRHAVETQHAMARRSELVAAEQRIQLRIGINLGDVVVEGDDLLGDGVNVAARLEAIAEPGGICLSRAAWEQVEGKLDIAVEDMGEQHLKNIARPVHAYRIVLGAAAHAGPTAAHTAPRLSLVVLPFANLSDNAAEEYFADGITEDITTDLSRIPDSFVIARNTAFTYKGRAVDAKQVGRELGVRYVLEGSVRRAGNRVRANVQLIDAETGAHLWAERFDCDRVDLMEVQDEITGRIAGALGAQLIDAESRRSLKERPSNPDAVDLTMQGWAVLHRPTSRESLAEGRALFERALALDVRTVDALIGVAYTYARSVNTAFSVDPGPELAAADAHIAKALALAPDRARVHWVRGVVLRNQLLLEQAVAAFETVIALDRNFAAAYGSLGDTLTFLGKPEETLRLNQQAIRLSPHDPELGNWLFDIGAAYALCGDDATAITWLLRARTANAHLPFVSVILATCYANLGRLDEARIERETAIAAMPWCSSIARMVATYPILDHPAFREISQRRVWPGLRLAGFPDKD
jgi:TolB-like protein